MTRFKQLKNASVLVLWKGKSTARCVTDKFLTHFYAPVCETIYIDQQTNFNVFFGDIEPNCKKTIVIIFQNGPIVTLSECLEKSFCYHLRNGIRNCFVCERRFVTPLKNFVRFDNEYIAALLDYGYENEQLFEKIQGKIPFVHFWRSDFRENFVDDPRCWINSIGENNAFVVLDCLSTAETIKNYLELKKSIVVVEKNVFWAIFKK